MTVRSLGLIVGLLATASPGYAADPGKVIAAIGALNDDMNAHSLQALEYVSPDGFTEVSPSFPNPTHISPEDLKTLLASHTRIHLHAHDMSVTTFGDIAIVTGFRDGGIDRTSPIPDNLSLQFTMVWQHSGSRWILRHFHLARPNS